MTRHFSLLVDDRPETLLRVTGLCLRRRADIVALRYSRTRGAGTGFARLDLELTVDERCGRRLAERLAALVEVRDVAELQGWSAQGSGVHCEPNGGRRVRPLPARNGVAGVR